MCSEHLLSSDIPLTRNPRIEEVLLRRFHHDLPGDPAWADLAMGDFVGLLADLGCAGEACRVLLKHLPRLNSPHRARAGLGSIIGISPDALRPSAHRATIC